jgi:ATP-dependent RNA helicase DDX49/DBP8
MHLVDSSCVPPMHERRQSAETLGRLAIPQTLQQRYIFIPSQVRDCYLFYLLSHLCTLTGATPLPTRDATTGKKPRRASPEPGDAVIDPLPQCILFVGRCRTAAQLSLVLRELGLANTALHSHLSQRDRLASLASFRAQRVALLIATDVGSRGLDIPAVEVVVNYDVPREPDDYVHRVGRTARAGRKGVSVTVVTEGDVDLVGLVEDRVGAKMTELELPEEAALQHLNKVATAQRVALLVR